MDTGDLETTGDRAASSTSDDELARLRQRLAFYEGFDLLIQENVARSGELLRRAAERQAEADRAAVEARTRFDRQSAAYQQSLSSLRAELDEVQTTLDRVAAGVTASLAAMTEMGADPPAAILVAAESAVTGTTARDRTLVVHGVRDVDQARSIAEFLRGQDGVVTVAPQEFAAGVLRLLVRSRSPLDASRVAGLAGPQGVASVESGDDTLIVELVGTTTR